MNSSSVLKRSSADIGTFYNMPVLEVISKPFEKREQTIEIPVDNCDINDIDNIFDGYEHRANGIIDKAEADAFDILANAQKKADAILAEAKANAQKLYSENYNVAQEKGYFEGIKQARAQSENKISAIMGHLENISDILAEEKQAIIDSSHNLIINLASEIAQKIVSQNFVQEHHGAFLSVFQNAVRNMPPAENLIVTVSGKDYRIATFNAQKLMDLAPGFKNIEIRYDDYAESGTLKLENSIMVVDASVSTQINLLKQDILSM